MGVCLVVFLFTLLCYSYWKGKKMIDYVDITFNEHKRVYHDGETFVLTIEVPKQQMLETRELVLEIEYTSLIEKKTTRVQERILLQRSMDGRERIEYPLSYGDWLTIEIKGFYMKDLCGCFRFRKQVEFFENILILPKDYPIENGEVMNSIHEYGNIRLIGRNIQEKKTEVVIFLDIDQFCKEVDWMIRTHFLSVVYSISMSLFMHKYRQKFLFGEEVFVIEDYEDYFLLFCRIFEQMREEYPQKRPKNMDVVTHIITTGKGLPIEHYHGKTIAVIRDAKDIDRFYQSTEYVIVNDMAESLFYLSL